MDNQSNDETETSELEINQPSRDDISKKKRSRLSRFGAVASVCFLIPMAILVASKLFEIEIPALIMIQAILGLVLLPSYAIFAFGLFSKRWLLSGTAAIIIVFHVVWALPELRPASDLSDSAKTAPHISLFTQNMLYKNENPSQISDYIKRKNPDFVFLQEVSYGNTKALKKSDAYKMYPYKHELPIGETTGIATWSKYPLSNTEVMFGSPFAQLRSVANVNGRNLVLWNIHTNSPVRGTGYDGVASWNKDMDLLKNRLHSETEDVLAAGDFNAAWNHSPFQDILGDMYKEGHVERGRGYARTWPVDNKSVGRIGGVVRIDHVLTTKNVVLTSIDESPANGSDHRGIFTHIALL